LGFDVDPINSVQFSNHTGYGYFTGQRLGGQELLDLISGLEKNNLLKYSHLLTGNTSLVHSSCRIYLLITKCLYL
jgi:pyridoxine kinase